METTQEYIDDLTGEVIETAPDRITLEELPKFGRLIASQRKHIDHLKSPRPDCTCKYCNVKREFVKLQEIITKHTVKCEETIEHFTGISQQLMDSIGKDKIEYPGLGRFRYRKMPVRMEIDDDIAVSTLDEQFVKVIHEVEPDTKAIKDHLKSGGIVPGFSLVEQPPKFEFKEE